MTDICPIRNTLRSSGRSATAAARACSYIDFRLDHGIARKSVSPSLKLLDHLGLIEIEPGWRLVNVFRFSNRWRTVDEVEAVRLAALAREVKPHRTFEKRREAKPVKPPKPKPMPSKWDNNIVGAARRSISSAPRRPRIMQRRVPSLRSVAANLC